MSEEKIKEKQNVRFFFSSGIILQRRRTSSTKQYSEGGLMGIGMGIATLIKILSTQVIAIDHSMCLEREADG